jgi:hypothetical protein
VRTAQYTVWGEEREREFGGKASRCTLPHAVFGLCREFSGVSAHVDTIVKERKDKVTGKPRAATADDYASVSFKLQPRRSAEAGPLWGGTAGDGSGNGNGSVVVSSLRP